MVSYPTIYGRFYVDPSTYHETCPVRDRYVEGGER